MAFTTEFVMGAGGAQVEEIPASVNGNGPFTLATVDAGTGAWVWVDGARGGAAVALDVGNRTYTSSNNAARVGGGGYFTGTVPVAYRRSSGLGDISFEGTVCVIRV